VQQATRSVIAPCSLSNADLILAVDPRSTISSELNRWRVMIKPRLRLYVCASAVAVSLGGSVLTQAAGPGEFISRLWKREPAPKKEVASGFSPFRWLKRDESGTTASSVKVSDGGRQVIAERPQLVSDPFLAEQLRTGTAHEPASATSKGVIVRPQPRSYQRPAPLTTAPTLDLSSRTESEIRERVPETGRAQLPELQSKVASQVATSTTQSPASTRPAGNGEFVDGFDGEFQKLFKEVIDESRQEKERPTSPDSSVAGFEPSTSENLPDAELPTLNSEQQDFAEFVQERRQASVSDLIQQSRDRLDSSVLARQMRANGGVQQPVADSQLLEQTSVSAASHSASRRSVAGNGSSEEADLRAPRLQNQAAQSVNQLIVPSEMVPERKLFSTSEEWLDRGQLNQNKPAAQTSAPDLQPVVRVVPGNRGNGVVIESGQWSPIRSRVTPNAAPARSVPDTSQFRRLSFEGADGTPQGGTVQAIGESTDETSGAQSGQSSRSNPALSVPSALENGASFRNDMPMMMVPDGRTGQSMDAAELGAALAVAPEPPQMNQTVFEWPDESEIAASAPDNGVSWGTTAFCLAIAAGVASMFFRRKSQDGAFGMIGTSTRSEIS
jgi:hypothetical protein